MAYEGKIEAVLFISGNPVHFDKLCEIFSLSPAEMLSELKSLEKIKEKEESGLSLIKIDGAYQLCTKQETSEYVKRFLEMKKAPPLSKAALEVLAITAYHQPVTRSFIEQVRGIDSSSIVAGLEDKGLIAECGHLDAPGRPALFVTTEAFLRSFGLESIEDLPELPNEFSLDNGQMSLNLSENNNSEAKEENQINNSNLDSDTKENTQTSGEIDLNNIPESNVSSQTTDGNDQIDENGDDI